MGTRQGRLPEPSDRRPVCAIDIISWAGRRARNLGLAISNGKIGMVVGIRQSTNYFLLLCVSRPGPLGK